MNSTPLDWIVICGYFLVLLGLLSTKTTATGAIITLVFGFIIGMAKLVLELWSGELPGILFWLAGINFLYFGFGLFVFCLALLVAIRLTTKPSPTTQPSGLTFKTIRRETRHVAGPQWTSCTR